MEKNRDTRRIEREAGRAREKDEEAVDGMKDAIKSAMRDDDTHRNISQELLDARRGDNSIKHRESFGDDGEIITGYHDERPWDRD